MIGSYIGGNVYHTVEFGGTATYSSPLYLGPSANVNPATPGDNGIYSIYTGANLHIAAGAEVYGATGDSTVAGGIGVDLAGPKAFAANYGGGITGGSNMAGSGGDGLSIQQGYMLNGGTITGGSASGDGASGGVGVSIAGAMLENGTQTQAGAKYYDAQIKGGDGSSGANGGAGVYANGGHVSNDYIGCSITGGNVVSGLGSAGAGVQLVGSASLYNAGSITGGTDAVGSAAGIGVDAGADSTVVNHRTITGGSSQGDGAAGVKLAAGAQLTNYSYSGFGGGKIYGGNDTLSGSGGVGVDLSASGAYVNNSGLIQGGTSLYETGGAGVSVAAGATLDNTRTIQGGNVEYSKTPGGGSGGAGAILDGGTLTTSGLLAGGYNVAYGKSSIADSVFFTPGVDSTLVVQPNASFDGAIGGFAIGDSIDIANLTPKQVAHYFGVTAINEGGGVYGFNGSASGETLTTTYEGTLDFAGNFAGDHFVLTPDGTAITLAAGTLPCYCRGTLIRTAKGETRVEDLAVGDLVLTARGELRPIRWLGSRGIDCSRYPNPAVIWPIRIQAGAFAQGLPARDLWVSPGHSMLVEGVLIQAEKLVNGATIVQVPRQRIEYWHVELDSHDIILAEGLPAESYLDTGNRAGFVNGGAYLEAYPDFKPKHWADTCVPLVLEGPQVEHAKAALLARAQELGYAMTEDADVHVVADGKRIEPVRLGEKRLAFMLPAAATSIELRCRSFTSAHIDPASNDQRLLGICVGRLQLDGIDVGLENDAAFTLGWHPLENNSDADPWRWSCNRASLPSGTQLVVIDLRHPGYYWAAPTSNVIALFG